MSPQEKLAEVITANKSRQRLARELNTRAGAQLFPALNQSELREWLAPRLSGARNAREVNDFHALQLEVLDEALVAKVEAENPVELTIPEIGAFAVHYRDGYAPQLNLAGNSSWLLLPDEGLRLPGGREVAVKVVWDSWYSTGPKVDLAALKTECAERKAAKDFDAWQKPVIEIPYIMEDVTMVPALREEVFGQHALTNEPLLAFGAVACGLYYREFGAKWFRNRDEAVKAREATVAQINELKAEVLRKEEEIEARRLANAAEVERQHLAQAEAERLRLEEEARKQAEAATLRSRVEAGEILLDFCAWHRRGGMTGCGDGWVIRQDGSRRIHDTSDVPRHKSDGTYQWQRVEMEELALLWKCGHRSNVDGSSEFVVAKLPVGGCTSEQLTEIEAIEAEIGASVGAFGLNAAEKQRREALLNMLREKMRRCPVTGEQLEWDGEMLKQLLGSNGLTMADSRAIARLVKEAWPFPEQCDGRDAQVVQSVHLGELGIVETLAYHKYGQWNCSHRFRDFTPEEKACQTGPSEPATPASLDLTKLFGGNARMS